MLQESNLKDAVFMEGVTCLALVTSMIGQVSADAGYMEAALAAFETAEALLASTHGKTFALRTAPLLPFTAFDVDAGVAREPPGVGRSR